LENITTLVLAVFTFNFQVSQYKYIAIRADCNSAAVSANITVSSALKLSFHNVYGEYVIIFVYVDISVIVDHQC
jgi:hypothetical protein